MRTLGPTNLLRILAGFKSNGFDFSKQRGVTKEKGCKRIPERVITEKDFNLEVLDETVRSFQRFVLFCSLFHTRHTNATKTQIRKRREGEGENVFTYLLMPYLRYFFLKAFLRVSSALLSLRLPIFSSASNSSRIFSSFLAER